VNQGLEYQRARKKKWSSIFEAGSQGWNGLDHWRRMRKRHRMRRRKRRRRRRRKKKKKKKKKKHKNFL